MRNVLRATDVAARIGGDEFVLLLPNSDMASAAAVAERLTASAAAGGENARPIGLCFGVADRQGGAESLDDLMRRADQALYTKKRARYTGAASTTPLRRRSGGAEPSSPRLDADRCQRDVHLRTPPRLLALSVLVIGGSVWLIADQQRNAVIAMQGQLRASSDLLTSMLDQETGLRGYALTGELDFLKPYVDGRLNFERRCAQAKTGQERAPAGRLQTLTETAREWQAVAEIAVDQVARRGPLALSLDSARTRKTLMNRFRDENPPCAGTWRSASQHDLKRARWFAFGFVVLFGATVLMLGLVALERQARRDRARAKQRREYVDALQAPTMSLRPRTCCAGALSG